jgi:sec-independent protein translocase protein TatA
MIGTTEILIIAGIVLVLFGSAAIPKFARSLGKARKEFEAGVKEGMQEGETRPDKLEGSRKDDGKA